MGESFSQAAVRHVLREVPGGRVVRPDALDASDRDGDGFWSVDELKKLVHETAGPNVEDGAWCAGGGLSRHVARLCGLVVVSL